MASNLRAMFSNLERWLPTQSDGLQPKSEASKLRAMASNLRAMFSNLERWLQPRSDGLQPKSDVLQAESDGLQLKSDVLQPRAMAPTQERWPPT